MSSPDTEPTIWNNHYRCPECRDFWEDQWDCQVEDDCPSCGLRHITPYYSDDGSGSEEARLIALAAADEALLAEQRAEALVAPPRG